MNGKLAIISTNEQQYSETFIRSQIKHLPFELVVYSSGYLPTKLSMDRGDNFRKISSTPWKRLTPEQVLERSFKKNNISCVLAQYGPSGVEVMNVCKKLGIPLIVHFHGFDAYRNDTLNSYGQKYSDLFANASAVIAVSQDMSQQLLSLGCAENKLHYIPYGVNLDFFESNEEERANILSCGRFVGKKAPDKVLKSFALILQSFPDVILTMIGDGELLEECKLLTHELGISNQVNFAGACSHDDVKKMMSQSAVFVQHSIRTEENDSEGTPLSIIEAAAMELPIVATNHGGIPDVLVHDKSGLLVEEGDVEGMAESVIQLLNNEDLRKTLGENARASVLEKFEIQRYLNDLSNLIQDCEDEKL